MFWPPMPLRAQSELRVTFSRPSLPILAADTETAATNRSQRDESHDRSCVYWKTLQTPISAHKWYVSLEKKLQMGGPTMLIIPSCCWQLSSKVATALAADVVSPVET